MARLMVPEVWWPFISSVFQGHFCMCEFAPVAPWWAVSPSHSWSSEVPEASLLPSSILLSFKGSVAILFVRNECHDARGSFSLSFAVSCALLFILIGYLQVSGFLFIHCIHQPHCVSARLFERDWVSLSLMASTRTFCA